MGTGFSSLFNDDDNAGGRTVARPSATSRDRRAPPHTYPAGFQFHEYGNGVETDVESSQPESKKPLKIVAIDYCIEKNVKDHYTDLYDITEANTNDDGVPQIPQLVIRRGCPFDVRLTFDRNFENENDELQILFEIGSTPKESKGTLINMDPSRIVRGKWCFEIDDITDNEITVKVQASPDCIVGKWELVIHTSLKSAEEKKNVYRYLHNQPIYILFNPWCKDDKVYLDDEILVDEYVINDTGKLYRGSADQIGASPWNFGQFEEDILECSIFLLDKSINYQGRGDPVHVVRAISAIVNSQGDRGVLSGRWSGNYKDGTAPTAWVGSVSILQQYYKDKNPVKYGQCWVFSGVVTTVCRALGIPSRSVTNFASAHDCDDNITIDKHWDVDGKPLKDLNEDSVWNFHVWNEAWMARHDLPTGYGGWQAFDATPQETSGGVYCAGPASVKAIREGLLNTRYDAAFIYAEVNADRVHWKQQKNGKFQVQSIEKHSIGKKISTLCPRKSPQNKQKRSFIDGKTDDPSRQDITDDYKYAEGSEEERAAVYRAHVNCTRAGEIHPQTEKGEADVKFSLKQKDHILVGSPFNVVLNMQNMSRSVRTIFGNIRICPVHYTGVSSDKEKQMRDIKVKDFEIELQPVKSEDYVMRISVDEYVDKFVDQIAFEIYVSATVEETSQNHLAVHTYRLRRPDLQLTAPQKATVGEPFTVKIYLLNPLPLALTDCVWDVEGPGITKSKKISQTDIDPNDQVEITVELTPKKAGAKEIIASFTSKQLTDITGSCTITVNKS